MKLFQEIRPTVGNPAPFIYYSDSRKERVWINIGSTGFTLFRRFRRFRRAEHPDEYRMQCTPPKYLLRHKCLRKDHFMCCSSLEWHLWRPLVLKVTPQSDEMPDSTVLRVSRTTSVNNLKTISEVGNNLTYPGSFVSPSNTYDQRLKKVPFEKQTTTTKNKKNKKTRNSHNIPGPYKLKVQWRRIPLIWIDYSWAKASHAPCVIYARMHFHFKQAGRNKKRFLKRTLTCSGVSLFILWIVQF